MKTELLSALSAQDLLQSQEEPPRRQRRLLPLCLVVLLVIVAVVVVLLHRGQTTQAELFGLSLRVRGSEAELSYGTAVPCRTSVRFSDRQVVVDAITAELTTEHRCRLSGLSERAAYRFVIVLASGRESLPYSFPAGTPQSDFRAYPTNEGAAVLRWRQRLDGRASLRARSAPSDWDALEIRPSRPTGFFTAQLTGLHLPDALEYILRQPGRLTVEHVQQIDVGHVLHDTVAACPVVQATRNMFADGPAASVPWQKGALPSPDEFNELLTLLPLALPAAQRLFADDTVAGERKLALSSSLAACSLLRLWAPTSVRTKLEAVVPVGRDFAGDEEIDGATYRRETRAARTLVEFPHWCVILPTNYCADDEEKLRRRARHYLPESRVAVSLRDRLPGPVDGDVFLYLHLGNFWSSTVIRIRIGASTYVLFTKRIKEGRDKKRNDRRILKPSYYRLRVPSAAFAAGTTTLRLDSLARFAVAQLPAIRSIHIAP